MRAWEEMAEEEVGGLLHMWLNVQKERAQAENWQIKKGAKSDARSVAFVMHPD